ncbi:MAG: hypothetical protein JNL82_32420 [Myxococcales bacterium]|nr:hypothetical protein [Myxococcales bacterium]
MPFPATPPCPVVVNPAPYPRVPPPPPPPRKGKFVFAAMPGLVFGVNAMLIPSVNISLFFGGRLRRSNWALGYQITGNYGLADRYLLGLFAHRHALTAIANFGARGFASVGGGLAFMLFYPGMVELETRVGVRLGRHKRALLGGHVRLSHNFYYRERAPLPQVGLFAGFSFL